MTTATDITKLHARIEYLEDNRRYIQNALETVLSLGDFNATNENKSNNVESLLERAGDRICRIISFESWAFYLVDEASFLFNLANCAPPQMRNRIEQEVESLIDQGMFAWAVREKRGVIIPSQNRSEQFLLHVITSGGRIRGMFLGTLPQGEGSLADTSMTLLSIILLRVANALEDLEFCRFIENQKDILEEKVTARTKALTHSETRLKNSMEKANQLAKKAKEASEAKSDFLAKMSHELRTPLNGIIGMVEVALATELDENQQNILQIANRESFALLKVINDILDFSKVEAGKVELEQVPFNLRAIIREVSETIAPQVSKKRLSLNTHVNPNIPTQLIGDPYRLKQVLLNLAGNALKFTEQGGIDFLCEIESETMDLFNIKIMVKDTGIGIPLKKQTTIFQDFTQADESTTRKYGGTGLGITISKQLVELMGGALALMSQENQGSTFYFSIPLDKSSTHQSKPTSKSNVHATAYGPLRSFPTHEIKNAMRDHQDDISILLVDDYPTNRKVASMHLSSAGYSVDTAENGRLAVEAFQKNKYNLILMDIQMPVMDGHQATKKIREIEHSTTVKQDQSKSRDNNTGNRVPIIAMTAHAYQKDADLCIDNGMDGFITKPIRRDDLLNIVAQWLFHIQTQNPLESPCLTSTDQSEPMDLPTAVAEFGSEKMVREVTEQLILNIDDQVNIMIEALAKDDLDTLQRESHSIKGGAGTIEAHPLASLAAELEDLCRDQNPSAAGPALDDLRIEFGRLRTFVNNL